MRRGPLIIVLAVATWMAAAAAGCADELVCRGTITSIQGEGLVARTHRFEVEGVTGSDLSAVIENCKRIARDKQNVAARRNPGGNFRPMSDVDLQCVQGGQKSAVRRSVKTAP